MTYAPAKELVEILRKAYLPCPGFKYDCEGTATWAPQKGHVPRGFIGALGDIKEVEVVILTAQPDAPPLPEEPGLYSQVKREELLDQTCQYTFECFRRRRTTYHEGIRYLLDQIFDPKPLPGRPVEEDMDSPELPMLGSWRR